MNNLPTIPQLIETGALFVANHSGGKDSQALLIHLLASGVPASQILVIHASLGEVEWEGALELARDQAAAATLPFIVARPVTGFLEMVERRFGKRPDAPSWPSPQYRQCTSDLKRGPIEREVRRYAKAYGYTSIVNCTGLRAAESPNRAKLETFSRNVHNCIAGREWFDWLPIHAWTTGQVFAAIADAGQQPHPAYAKGNERLSCVFCIMGSKRDLVNGAKHNPELFARYVALEAKTGYTMHASRISLAQIVQGTA